MFRRLKLIPWRSLLGVALVTMAIASVAEWALLNVLSHVPIFNQTLDILLTPPLTLITLVFAAIGIGALGVYGVERWQTQIILNAANLWALVGCLLLSLFVQSLFFRSILGLSEISLVGIILGVFWKGRRYWR